MNSGLLLYLPIIYLFVITRFQHHIFYYLPIFFLFFSSIICCWWGLEGLLSGILGCFSCIRIVRIDQMIIGIWILKMLNPNKEYMTLMYQDPVWPNKKAKRQGFHLVLGRVFIKYVYLIWTRQSWPQIEDQTSIIYKIGGTYNFVFFW